MADMHIHQEYQLANISKPYLTNPNYKKIMFFGSTELKNKISEFANSTSYNYAIEMMKSQQYLIAITNFEDIAAYKDSSERIAQCKAALKKIAEEHCALLTAKDERTKQINDNYTKSKVKAINYKKWGWLSLLFGFLLMISPLLLLEVGLGEELLILVCAGPIIMATVCPILISKGNKLFVKIHQEKSVALEELNTTYTPTQAMLNNIEMYRNSIQTDHSDLYDI